MPEAARTVSNRWGVWVMSSQLTIPTLQANVSLKEKTYEILKSAICKMNIYAPDAQLRLDERQLSE